MDKFAAYLISGDSFLPSPLTAESTIISSSFVPVSLILFPLPVCDFPSFSGFISCDSFSMEVSLPPSCTPLNPSLLVSKESFPSNKLFPFPVVHSKEPTAASPSGLAFLFRGEEKALILTMFEAELWLISGSGDSKEGPITPGWCCSAGEDSGKTWLLGELICATSLDSSVCCGDIWMESCGTRGDDEFELLVCLSVIEVSPTNGSIFLELFGIWKWQRVLNQ